MTAAELEKLRRSTRSPLLRPRSTREPLQQRGRHGSSLAVWIALGWGIWVTLQKAVLRFT
jgi:hypothetical protein